jgi:4-amino-4-deoxy-L-arabinose transferase-like glycosyltransferase
MLGVALAAALTAIAVRLAGARTWPAALACAVLFVCWKFWPIALDLLSESLYIPLLASATLAVIVMAQQPSAGRAALAGVLTGLATITRSTALLGWPAIALAAWSAWPQVAARRRLMAILLGCTVAIFSLISIRNWIVSGRFAPASTEFGVTLLGGNIPPDDLTIDGSPRQALYQRLRLEEATARVIEYGVTMPRAFAANIGRKALFALGFYEPYAEGWGTSPVYVLVWMSAVVGLMVGRPPGMPSWLFVLPAAIALSQYVAVVLVYPKGERLILPVHTLLVPYSAMAATALIARLRTPARRQLTL